MYSNFKKSHMLGAWKSTIRFSSKVEIDIESCNRVIETLNSQKCLSYRKAKSRRIEFDCCLHCWLAIEEGVIGVLGVGVVTPN